MKHAFRLGLAVVKGQKGEDHPKSKLTQVQVDEIRKSDKSAQELATFYGLSKRHVYSIKRKECWNND